MSGPAGENSDSTVVPVQLRPLDTDRLVGIIRAGRRYPAIVVTENWLLDRWDGTGLHVGR